MANSLPPMPKRPANTAWGAAAGALGEGIMQIGSHLQSQEEKKYKRDLEATRQANLERIRKEEASARVTAAETAQSYNVTNEAARHKNNIARDKANNIHRKAINDDNLGQNKANNELNNKTRWDIANLKATIARTTGGNVPADVLRIEYFKRMHKNDPAYKDNPEALQLFAENRSLEAKSQGVRGMTGELYKDYIKYRAEEMEGFEGKSDDDLRKLASTQASLLFADPNANPVTPTIPVAAPTVTANKYERLPGETNEQYSARITGKGE